MFHHKDVADELQPFRSVVNLQTCNDLVIALLAIVRSHSLVRNRLGSLKQAVVEILIIIKKR